MTKEEFIAQMVQTLAETYRVQMTAPAARAYTLTLEELSTAELRESGRRALRECEHMPSPAQLLRLGLKARKEGQETEVARTDRMLAAMKPSSYPTAEQLAEMRDDWKRTVKGLAEGKTPEAAMPASEPMTDEATEARKAELAAQLAEWQSKQEPANG